MTLLFQRKRRSALIEVPPGAQPALRLMELAITGSGVTDTTGIHTLTNQGCSFNTTLKKNGVASLRIPRGARMLTNNPGAGNHLMIDKDPWNLSAWVLLLGTQASSHTVAGDLATGTFYPMQYYANAWYAGDASVNKVVHSTPSLIGMWQHVNMSWDGVSNFRLHLDGVLAAKNGPGASPMKVFTTTGWEIGKRGGNVDSDMYLGSLAIDRGTFKTDASFVPELFEGAGRFGPSRHLSYADSADFNISGDRTIEALLTWNGAVDSSGYSTLWGQNPGANSGMRLSIRNNSGLLWGSMDSDSNPLVSSVNMPVGTQVHAAFVKESTTYSVYLAGQRVATGSGPATIADRSALFYLGSEEGQAGGNFIGAIKEFAFSSGAKYTGTSFTPPTTLNLTAGNLDNVIRGIDFGAGIVDVKGFPITNSSVVRI